MTVQKRKENVYIKCKLSGQSGIVILVYLFHKWFLLFFKDLASRVLKLTMLYELLFITSAINLRDRLLITFQGFLELCKENTSSNWKH